jgi:hypothetical protein
LKVIELLIIAASRGFDSYKSDYSMASVNSFVEAAEPLHVRGIHTG